MGDPFKPPYRPRCVFSPDWSLGVLASGAVRSRIRDTALSIAARILRCVTRKLVNTL